MARAVLGLLTVVIFTVALAAIGWPAERYRDGDFGSLYVMGQMLLNGGDQYDYDTYVAAHRAIGSRALTIVLPDVASFYPLTTALIAVPFALLPLSLAAPAWLVTQAALAIAALLALARRLFPRTFRRDAFLLVGLVSASQPAWLLAGGGNFGGFMLALAATAVTLLLAQQAVLAGVAAGVLLAIKPQPLAIAMLVVIVSLPRPIALRVAAGAAAVVLGAVALTIALRPAWISEFLAQTGRVTAYAARTRQSTVFGLLGPDLAWLSWGVVVLMVLGLLIWVIWMRPPLPLVAGVAIAASLFCAPYGWSYDHLSLAITVAVILALSSRMAERRRVGVLIALALFFILVPWMLFRLAFVRGDESLSALVTLSMFALTLVVAGLASAPQMQRE